MDGSNRLTQKIKNNLIQTRTKTLGRHNEEQVTIRGAGTEKQEGRNTGEAEDKLLRSCKTK